MPWPRRRNFLLDGGIGYTDKVLALNPLRYWPMQESIGTAAIELVAADNGTYARNVSLMGTGGGFTLGRTAPLFNGVADVLNIYSVALNAQLDGDEVAYSMWVKAANVGVWTDGNIHTILRLRVDASNMVYIQKQPVNNRITFLYISNGNTITNNADGLTTTEWIHLALRATRTGDGVRAWINGVEIGGATPIGANPWAGNLLNTATVIGASTTAPATPANFYIEDAVILPAISVDSILSLAVP